MALVAANLRICLWQVQASHLLLLQGLRSSDHKLRGRGELWKGEVPGQPLQAPPLVRAQNISLVLGRRGNLQL